MDKDSISLRKRIIILCIIGLIVALLFGTMGYIVLQCSKEPDTFRDAMHSYGFWGYVLFILLVVSQVIVAIIPAGIMQFLGGYAFGTTIGVILNLIGSIIGSMTVFALVKTFGMKFASIFISKKQLEKLDFITKSDKFKRIITIVFFIPGSPKDVLSYVAGFSELNWWYWLIISTLGRLPAIILTVIGADAIFKENKVFAIVAFALFILLTVAGVFIYRHIEKKNQVKD